jgi:hypothetical protein
MLSIPGIDPGRLAWREMVSSQPVLHPMMEKKEIKSSKKIMQQRIIKLILGKPIFTIQYNAGILIC